ncbi:hypothetical protein [Alienimonas californiensis]|uniref:Uncharacterized protein n=1 Tax=Alienimonas californiensis TaxID=2527989 RepID=A0A517P4Q4_9PLAN|nr:hypothetical protein [Alienimonas californiensis]QDT14326.1 hypothetical protein CA12_03980 [Alienimonas californiensis]
MIVSLTAVALLTAPPALPDAPDAALRPPTVRAVALSTTEPDLTYKECCMSTYCFVYPDVPDDCYTHVWRYANQTDRHCVDPILETFPIPGEYPGTCKACRLVPKLVRNLDPQPQDGNAAEADGAEATTRPFGPLRAKVQYGTAIPARAGVGLSIDSQRREVKSITRYRDGQALEPIYFVVVRTKFNVTVGGPNSPDEFVVRVGAEAEPATNVPSEPLPIVSGDEVLISRVEEPLGNGQTTDGRYVYRVESTGAGEPPLTLRTTQDLFPIGVTPRPGGDAL